MSQPATLAPPAGRRHGRDLTVGSIPRHLIAFSLPMLAGSAMQTAHSFINAIWVGQFLGKQALAAVAVGFPVVFVLVAAGAGLTMATSILISQYYGAGNMPAVQRVVNSSTTLIGGLSLVLTAAGELLTPAILRAMDTPPEVLPLAIGYMRIFLLSLPLGFGLFLTRSMLQGIGDSRTPLYYQGLAIVLTTVLDPLLMFGWLGLPKLGLNGTAWATFIAQSIGLGALVVHLHAHHNPVAPTMRWRGVDGHTAWTTIKLGVPAAMQQSLVSLGMVFITGIVNGFGQNAIAAFGVAGRVDALAFMPAMSFSMAVSSLTGQNIGAGRLHRVRQILLWGCALSGGVTLAVSALALAMPEMLCRIFTPDPAVIAIGRDYLRIAAPGYVLFAIMFISNGIINGSGHTMVPTLISLVSLWIVRVPGAWWLSHRMNHVDGVWYAIPVSFAVAMAASLLYYASGGWRRTVIRHQRTEAA